MDWSTILTIGLPVLGAALIVAMDAIVEATPPDWKVWGIPIGKYDGLIWKRIKARMGWGKKPDLKA
jgi:hypothetical protein